jgi:hypothetical protein
MNVRLAAAISACLVGACLAVVFLPGCGKSPNTSSENEKEKTRKVDPWEGVTNRLKRETDLASCKTALNQLNTDLAEQKDGAGAKGMTEAEAKKLAALVPLSSDDILELLPSAYTSLDPNYLADCFYLRDAARSIDPTGLTEPELARAAFAWVCRQMYLSPWEMENVGYIPAVPPTYSLRRGSGSGLERAYVFLAVLQQLGLDGCLIGPPTAQNKMTIVLGPNGKSVLQNGPFWAVGVRSGAEILLFDPWRGEPFPGPDGKSIGTLAQVTSNPDQLKAWFAQKDSPNPLTPEQVKNAAVFLAAPQSALAPRLGVLEAKLKADTGVRLTIDAPALKSRFAEIAPNGPGVDAKFWNPPADRFSYLRLLITFLPAEEGGLDRGEAEMRPYQLYRQSLFPKLLGAVPPGLKPQPAERLAHIILGLWDNSFFASPSPRERLQRGQFQDAARDLTGKIRDFGRGIERLREFDSAEMEQWVQLVNGVHDNLYQKRFPNPGQTTPQPDSDPDVMKAKETMEQFWRSSEHMVRVLIDRATAAPGRSEAMYILALAKHEEAERRQARGRAEGTQDAWREAVNAWDSFLEQDNAKALPVRTAHAKKLATRAKAQAETP